MSHPQIIFRKFYLRIWKEDVAPYVDKSNPLDLRTKEGSIYADQPFSLIAPVYAPSFLFSYIIGPTRTIQSPSKVLARTKHMLQVFSWIK